MLHSTMKTAWATDNSAHSSQLCNSYKCSTDVLFPTLSVKSYFWNGIQVNPYFPGTPRVLPLDTRKTNTQMCSSSNNVKITLNCFGIQQNLCFFSSFCGCSGGETWQIPRKNPFNTANLKSMQTAFLPRDVILYTAQFYSLREDSHERHFWPAIPSCVICGSNSSKCIEPSIPYDNTTWFTRSAIQMLNDVFQCVLLTSPTSRINKETWSPSDFP